MKSKAGITLIVALVLAALAVAAAAARTTGAIRPSAARTPQVASASSSCKTASIAYAGPLTGPAAFLGRDQQHWVDTFLTFWNSGKPIPGVPRGLQGVRDVPPVSLLVGDRGVDPGLR